MYKAMKLYVNDHANSGLLLHRLDCPQLPAEWDRAFISSCYTLNQVLSVARINYTGVRACPLCANKPDIMANRSDVFLLSKQATKPEKKIS